MTTTTRTTRPTRPTWPTPGAPLREVGEGAPRGTRQRDLVAAVAFVVALVLLPLAQVVPPSAIVAGAVLWLVLRLGARVRSL